MKKLIFFILLIFAVIASKAQTVNYYADYSQPWYQGNVKVMNTLNVNYLTFWNGILTGTASDSILVVEYPTGNVKKIAISAIIGSNQLYADTLTYDATKYDLAVMVHDTALIKQNYTDTTTYDATKYDLRVMVHDTALIKQNYSDTTTYDATKYDLGIMVHDTALIKQNYSDTTTYDATKYDLGVMVHDTALIKQNYLDTLTYDATKYDLGVMVHDTALIKQNYTDTTTYDATKYWSQSMVHDTATAIRDSILWKLNPSGDIVEKDTSKLVGIGKNTPAYSLDVQGAINTDTIYKLKGENILYQNTNLNNLAIGYNVLSNITTGRENIAIGNYALEQNLTGMTNTALGYSPLQYNTIGMSNTAIGYYALNANTTGDNNTALGDFPLGFNQTGSSNTAIGQNVLSFNTIGNQNTAMGQWAFYSNVNANDVTAIGYYAAASYNDSVACSGNTYIGHDADSTTQGIYQNGRTGIIKSNGMNLAFKDSVIHWTDTTGVSAKSATKYDILTYNAYMNFMDSAYTMSLDETVFNIVTNATDSLFGKLNFNRISYSGDTIMITDTNYYYINYNLNIQTSGTDTVYFAIIKNDTVLSKLLIHEGSVSGFQLPISIQSYFIGNESDKVYLAAKSVSSGKSFKIFNGNCYIRKEN